MTVDLPVFSFAAIVTWAVVVAVAGGYVLGARRYGDRGGVQDALEMLSVAIIGIGPIAALAVGFAVQFIAEGWS